MTIINEKIDFEKKVQNILKLYNIGSFEDVISRTKPLIKKYPDNLAMMSLLPLSMRMGGPKEALLHAIVRKNYGCTHFIVGRDHAGPGLNKENKPYYDPYSAQELLLKFQSKIGIKMVPFNFMVYNRSKKSYEEIDKINKNTNYNIKMIKVIRRL